MIYEYALDAAAFALREKRDLSWLSELGKLTEVFSKNDSGNISFGFERAGQKYFCKIAGLRTTEYQGDPQVAVGNLKKALDVYQDLSHENLIGVIDSFYKDDLLCVIFPWFSGECLFAHWTFDQCNRYEDPRSPYYKFMRLPVAKRWETVHLLFAFMVQVEERGYVAVDLYDGSLLYDFSTGEARVCDIDFFCKAPTVNTLGEEYWGSSRFKAPEESLLGARIDSITNVFTLGRLGLSLLGDDRTFAQADFLGGDALYAVFKKATSVRREDRYPSIAVFYQEFLKASGETTPRL